MDSHREPEQQAQELDPADVHRAMERMRQDPEAPIRGLGRVPVDIPLGVEPISEAHLELVRTPEGTLAVRRWVRSKAARGMQRRLLVAGTRRPRRTLVVGGR